MKSRLTIATLIAVAAAVGLVLWLFNAGFVNHWLAVHTGTVNEPGPYYGFWSGFGSDIAEFGIIGAIGTAAYQLFKKFNCHEPGCWRVGTHPAAGGQFFLCYRHHPDYRGTKPTHELIVKLHRENAEREAVIHERLVDLHEELTERIEAKAHAEAASSADHVGPSVPDGTSPHT